MSTTTLALIIMAAILIQVAIVTLRMIFCARRDPGAPWGREGSGGDGSLSGAGPTPESKIAGWDGYREFVVQRRVIEDGDAAVCSFYLAPCDGRPLPSFHPGQYLTFRLSMVDPPSGEKKTVVRCYSLSDRPRVDHYRVSIKRVPPPADQPQAPPGVSSNYFHDHVQEGDTLEVKAPAGNFHLMDGSLPIVLIAGGIGITPMLSIVNTVLERDDHREVWLFYGVRNGRELVMKQHLLALAAAHPNFHLHFCFSSPDADEAAGVAYQHDGRIDVALLRLTLKLARYQFYVCGPRPMMETLVPALAEWGVDTGDIHYESFGPASLLTRDNTPTTEREVGEPPVAVTLSRSGKTLIWDAGADSLLEFAENHGITVDSGCRAGSCGCCQTKLEAGEVSCSQEPDAEVLAGNCLLCISRPKGDITLAA